MNRRIVSVVTAFLFVAAVAAAQAPQKRVPPRSAPALSSSRPVGDLAQVMRGIFFTNANLIFDVQQIDPGAPKKSVDTGTGGGATATFANIYTGWQVVENAAIALAESSDLIVKGGRLCSNGKRAPVERADWVKFAEGMRETGRAALRVAQTKNRDKMIEVTDQVAEACANCHEVYRDKGPAGSPARCSP